MTIDPDSQTGLEGPGASLIGNPRSAALRLLLVFVFGVLSLQLWRLQVVEGRTHQGAAEQNRIRHVPITGLRGVIYDRHGTILASNAPMFVASIIEADLPRARRVEIIGKLSQMLGTPTEEVERIIERNRTGDIFAPIQIKTHLERDVALRLEEQSWELPGVLVTVDTTRGYDDSTLASHLLGYLAQPSPESYENVYKAEGYRPRDQVGVSGLESTYESDLRGRAGSRLVEVDVAGRPIRELSIDPPETGKNLYLTIDMSLQRAVADILRQRVGTDTSGAAVVTNPQNGEILAMVSFPSYDGNIFSARDRDDAIGALLADKNLPLFHRAIAGQYPPGSTFKLVTAIGALQEAVATRSTRVRCEGNLRLPNQYNPGLFSILKDWAAHGDQDFVQAIANSCDVYFYMIGGGAGNISGLGNDRLANYARLLGFGSATGIDIPGEELGRVPTGNWKAINFGEQWLTGDTYNMSIGQGFMLATPLQVANMTNGIANGGALPQLRLGRLITDGDGRVVRRIDPPVMKNLGVRADVLAVVREGMEQVMFTDQARAWRMPDVVVAGKTGTAEYAGPLDEKGQLPTHGWFTAYGPVDRPEVAVTVFIEKGGGPSDGVPTAMQIMSWYFSNRAAITR